MASTETDLKLSLTDSPGNGSPTPLTAGIPGGSLTTTERLQASTLAQSFVLQIASLKAPLRRLVLEEVRRFLGEE